MEVIFVPHSLKRFEERIRRWNLSLEDIKEFALNPDFTLPDKKHAHREWRVKKYDGRCIKIVVEQEKNILIIVTVMLDRTLRRKGLCD